MTFPGPILDLHEPTGVIFDLLQYFGFELGAQTNVDLKNERYAVHGEHDAGKLQDILDGFIRRFVLCPACENPETTLVRTEQTCVV